MSQNPPATNRKPPVVRLEGSMFAGPIPPPQVLQQYEQSLPGLADRIVQMAEKQMDQRHRMERREWWAEMAGTFFGGLIAIGSLVAGTFLIYNDKNISGLITILASLVGLVGAFVYSKKIEKGNSWKS